MIKKRFMQDLERVSQDRNDEKLLAIARKGTFYDAIEEISNRKEARDIVESVLAGKPYGEKIIEGLKPHYGTPGLKSVLKQTGKIIGEEDFNQGAKALEVMKMYAGQLDIYNISKEIKELSRNNNDLSSFVEVFKKYENLQGKELIMQSLQNQMNDLLEKPYSEIIEGWKSDYVHSTVRDLQNKRGLSPTLCLIRETAKKIQKREAMEDIALLSDSLSYEERSEKMHNLRYIMMMKGSKDNFNQILRLGKNANQETVHQMGQIALWTENKKLYNELLTLASEKNISYELDRLEKIVYWNNEKIFEDSFNVLKEYYGKSGSKRVMKKLAAINNFSQNEFVSKYVSKLAKDYINNSNRDKYLAEIQRYVVRGDIDYAKEKLIGYNKPYRKENLENKLKKFVGKLK